MRAGPLRYRLRILKPVINKSPDTGTDKLIYVETKTVYAERVKVSGSNILQFGEYFPDYRTEYNIRDAHEIEENWRVEEIGGKLYNVNNIIPNRERGFLKLICERVNL